MRRTVFINSISTLLLFLVFAHIASPAFATGPAVPEELVEVNESEKQPIEPYDIDISFGTQSPWSKKLPVIIKIKPNVDSSRTEIALDSALGVGYRENFNDFFAVKAGQVYEKSVTLFPENPGRYTITVNVIDWGYSTNRSSSVNFQVTFGEDLVTEPKTANYDNMNILRYIINIVILLLVMVGVFFGGKKGLMFLKKWLQPPQ